MSLLKRYLRNPSRAFFTIGPILFGVVALGLAAEMWLRGIPLIVKPGQERLSFWTIISLIVASARIAFPVMGALVLVPLVITHLMHQLYSTKNLMEAHDALNRMVFGKVGRRPLVIVKEGEISFGKDTFAARVGGPATLIIYNDTAVVTEQYGRTKRILGPGIHEVERFEKVWETVDLRPQRWVYEVFALTKEGIPISCQADISFQIDDQPKQPWAKRVDGDFPYAEDAVFLAATSKWIREPEREDTFMNWAGRIVIGLTEGALRNILAEYRLDWLIAPQRLGQEHPREKIRRQLREALQERVGNVGARLLNVEIGPIEVKTRDEETSRQLAEIVSKQWIDAWYADWQRRALISKAEGEAELLRADTARMQAQAEMVVTLIEAMQSAIASGGTIEPYILAMRFVEALRWMSYNTISRNFMPPEALSTLRRLQKWLAGDTEKSGEEESEKEKEE